jgi:ferrochelatase
LDKGVPYDAFLLVSFGGPEGPADVLPFLRNVTRGRNVPDERLAEVAAHYYAFGGVSPLNAQCRDLLAAIGDDFAAAGIGLPLYWGNRNWAPYLTDTVAKMAADGIRHAIAFATSAYSSYSSCRQYLEDIERARAVTPGAPRIDKIPPYYGEPGFAESFAAATAAAIESLPEPVRNEFDLVFTAHSIPETMAAASGPAGGAYPAQLRAVAARVAARFPQARSWQLGYQSRSGPPSQPWLGPDIGDCLAALAEAGSQAVVCVPIGFVSDHMEVLHDLDVEAAAQARQLGLAFARASAPGAGSRFVAMITDLVRQHTAGGGPGRHGAGPLSEELCRNGCCMVTAAWPGR